MSENADAIGLVGNCLVNMISDHCCGDRDIARGQALRDGHHVGYETEALAPEPVATASEAADHLVREKENVMALQDFADAGEIPGRRRNDPAGTHDRFGDHCGYAFGSF
ncbi:hypothetical protein D3C71_1676550 [compost metagenome]